MGLDSPVPPLNLSRASPSSATCDDGHNGDTTSTSVDDGMQIMGGEPAGRLSDSDAATVPLPLLPRSAPASPPDVQVIMPAWH